MYRYVQVLLLVLFIIQPWRQMQPGAAATGAFDPQTMDVRLHPDGTLLVGDQISIEVFTPAGEDFDGSSLHASFQGSDLGNAPFYGAAGDRYRAILQWVWDTRGLAAGEYTLVLTIPERNQTWEERVVLAPADPEIQERAWQTVEVDCCFIHTITGTDAERDLDVLVPMIEGLAATASRQIGTTLDEKIDINLIPRILGHGGFTSDEVYVSYADDNYANPEVAQILYHEMLHRYDGLRESNLRPSILIEGLAVYLSGGHYERESITFRAAALLHSGRYIPLQHLADDFYPAQHESGYILAGALVGYMVERWGWEAFDGFYRDIQPDSAGQSRAIDRALREHFGVSLEELESGFLGRLELLPAVPDIVDDVEGTITLFDAVRAYQKLMDNPAYFEQVWLPGAEDMRSRGIVADYLRGPDSSGHLQIEARLYEAQAMLDSGDYEVLQQTLSLVESELNRVAAQ